MCCGWRWIRRTDNGDRLWERAATKELFWELTEQIDRWIKSRECSQPDWMYYSTALDAINLGSFQKKAAQIRKELGVKSSVLSRDYFGPKALRRLSIIQEVAARAMEEDDELRPTAAVKQALQSLKLKPLHYRD